MTTRGSGRSGDKAQSLVEPGQRKLEGQSILINLEITLNYINIICWVCNLYRCNDNNNIKREL